jgi:aminomuconate-semialdehyde/2-hydroxymuconate-6-semialdehyde dehydrogenase
VSLELGGKGANVVFSDADLDTAVEWSVKAVVMQIRPES